jgi:hypothetical protein
MTESEFCRVVSLMLDQKYFYPEYPPHFESDCRALWINSYSPEDAVRKLAEDYGFISDQG